MTLRQFEYVIAVAEEGSFTEAARRLGVTQPALSHQIRDLEQSLRAVLFERGAGGAGLTAAGAAFLGHAAAAVASARQADSAARAAGLLAGGELRLATLQSVTLGIVPAAITVWRRAHPLVPVRLEEYTHAELLAEAMNRGGADVAVGPPSSTWRGPVRTLGHEEFLIVLPSDDPLLSRGSDVVALGELADRPWVLYAREVGLSLVVDGACATAGFTPRVAARIHYTDTAVELAVAGLGPALVPGNMIPQGFAGHARRPDPPVLRELAAFTRPDPSPAALAFIEVLAEHGTL
ncbi:LysR family transcriptional regulator [Streptomyces mirabilis]